MVPGKLQFDRSWTLFLDRDGVINKKIDNDYVKRWEEFHFLPGVHEALKKLEGVFGRIVVVTNQQGIGKGVFTESDLDLTHRKMVEDIVLKGGRIDKVYFCPELATPEAVCRKPATGMAFQALKDFPDIEFNRSVIVGDSISDMQFGRALGMKTIFIKDKMPGPEQQVLVDHHFVSLYEFSLSL